MSTFMRRVAGMLSLACLVAATGVQAAAPVRVAPEVARGVPMQARLAWRAAAYPRVYVARLQFAPLAAARVEKLRERNARRLGKPLEVGLARATGSEALGASRLDLQWVLQADGGAVARFEVESPAALGLRAGLVLAGLDPRMELRFGGVDGEVVARASGREAARLRDRQDRYWTPATPGERQLVEIHAPAQVAFTALRVRVDAVSHLLSSGKDGFPERGITKSAGACNVDVACSVATLGQDFVAAKNAVALMQFVVDGGSYVCTGTLLNDSDSSTQLPYFYSAHHCIEDQAIANTLETYWNFEAATCGGSPGSYQQLTGGALHLYSDAGTDALLLRLNVAAPAGATFSGWDREPLPASTAVTAIHHPAGDVKKVSQGQHVASDASNHAVGWLDGTTEGGSSGSGLFTRGWDGKYYLRGGLYGGTASCANTGSLATASNRDYYSRFDVVFPRLAPYLDTVQVRTAKRFDFDGDERSDILWRNAGTGANVIWRAANHADGLGVRSVSLAWDVAGAGDFDGDGAADVLWRNRETGSNAIWHSADVHRQQAVTAVRNLEWAVAGTGDFDGDGYADIFWRNPVTGSNVIWRSGLSSQGRNVAAVAGTSWAVAGIGDFDGDGRADVLWRNASTGANTIWKSSDAAQRLPVISVRSTAWQVVGVGDFDADARADLVWRNTSTGANTIWLAGNGADQLDVTDVTNTAWTVAAVADYDGDGHDDLLWRNRSNGQNVVWRTANAATQQAVAKTAAGWEVAP